MNLFAQQIKFEDTEGLDYPEGQLITEGDEGESVAAAVAEVTEEEAGLVEDERAMDGLVEDEETLSEVQEVVQDDAPKMEHAGLTPTGARLAKIILTRVVGKRHANKTLPKMEHFNSRSDARDATSFVVEGVGEALKSFWEALKAQFKKIWAKLKTWYVKTFSAAARISERAKTIRNRAESLSSTIDKKSFAFSQAKQLMVDGRLKEVSTFERALTNLNVLVEAVTNTPTDKAIEVLADDMDALSKEEGIETIISNINSNFVELSKMSKGDIKDPKILASLGADDKGDAAISASDVLPGDKQFVYVTLAGNSNDQAKFLRMTNFTFVNTKDKPRELGSDTEVTTLNASQIAKFADMIASGAESIAEAEAKWQKTDKAQEVTLRKIDEIIRDRSQDAKDDETADGKTERAIRQLSSGATQFVRRVGGVVAQVTGFALPVYAATLNWCEGSMRNYKK